MLLVGAELSVTVHVLDAPDPRLEGLQDTPEIVGLAGGGAVTVPPVAVIAMLLPAPDAATGLVTPMDAEVTPEASVTFTVAATPLPMIEAFMPQSMHVSVPVPGAQLMLFPPAVAAAPAAAEIEATLAGVYVSVH